MLDSDDDAPPGTPDFDVWPIEHSIVDAQVVDGAALLTWSDGRKSAHHALFLRENDAGPATTHPLSREPILSPLDIAADVAVLRVEIDPAGALQVHWSSREPVSRFHPGWLRAHAWLDGPRAATSTPQPTLWSADRLRDAPSFDGPAALLDDDMFLQWLVALRDFGVARLRDLPIRAGLLEEIVARIGPIRESNFGRTYSLKIKTTPDSNAFTSAPLLQHIDMPTRESPHGLQFLYCTQNTARGGDGLYCDAFKIAEDMRREEPAHFESLTTDIWEFNNRSETSSYRARGPIFERDAEGRVSGARHTPWLRAPLIAPLAIQARAYAAVRALTHRTQDPRYLLRVRYAPGDLFAFDNRRVLHGRDGYDAAEGERIIDGAYADRDDLHSAIRVLTRRRLSAQSRDVQHRQG